MVYNDIDCIDIFIQLICIVLYVQAANKDPQFDFTNNFAFGTCNVSYSLKD